MKPHESMGGMEMLFDWSDTNAENQTHLLHIISNQFAVHAAVGECGHLRQGELPCAVPVCLGGTWDSYRDKEGQIWARRCGTVKYGTFLYFWERR